LRRLTKNVRPYEIAGQRLILVDLRQYVRDLDFKPDWNKR